MPIKCCSSICILFSTRSLQSHLATFFLFYSAQVQVAKTNKSQHRSQQFILFDQADSRPFLFQLLSSLRHFVRECTKAALAGAARLTAYLDGSLFVFLAPLGNGDGQDAILSISLNLAHVH